MAVIPSSSVVHNQSFHTHCIARRMILIFLVGCNLSGYRFVDVIAFLELESRTCCSEDGVVGS
jgi:hypothetical protein